MWGNHFKVSSTQTAISVTTLPILPILTSCTPWLLNSTIKRPCPMTHAIRLNHPAKSKSIWLQSLYTLFSKRYSSPAVTQYDQFTSNSEAEGTVNNRNWANRQRTSTTEHNGNNVLPVQVSLVMSICWQ